MQALNPYGSLFRFDAAPLGSGFRYYVESCCGFLSSQKKMAAYAIGSKRNRNRFRDYFGTWTGARGRVRFDSAVAKHWTLSRRTDPRDLRCAVAAECFLHGAGERRRVQIERLRSHVAADLSTISRRRRSVRLRFRFQIRTLFTLAAAKDCIGRIFRSATASTNRLTPARRGRIWDCATVSRSRSWRSIQKSGPHLCCRSRSSVRA